MTLHDKLQMTLHDKLQMMLHDKLQMMPCLKVGLSLKDI